MQVILIVLVLTIAEVMMISGQFPQDFLTNLLLKSWEFLERGTDLLKKLFVLFYN